MTANKACRAITMALAVCVFASPAAAEPWLCRIYPPVPPAHYLAEGQRLYDLGLVTVHTVRHTEIATVCGGVGWRECAWQWADGTCDLYVTRARDLCSYQSLYVALFNHGLGHCGGWPSHHPTG